MRARFLALVLLLAALILPATACAAPRIEARLSPDRPGAATTVTLDLEVGAASSPLVGLGMELPRGISAGFSTLGLDTCDPAQLEARGAGACPRNSVVGRGRVTVSVPLGAETVFEQLATTMFMAPAVGDRTTTLTYVEGSDPVISELTFHGSLVGDDPPFDALIEAEIPAVAGLPGSPPVSVVRMRTELAPKGLRYTKKVNGKTVGFTPEGFEVPSRCPAGGFPFAANFSFADGVQERATTRVPCPRK